MIIANVICCLKCLRDSPYEKTKQRYTNLELYISLIHFYYHLYFCLQNRLLYELNIRQAVVEPMNAKFLVHVQNQKAKKLCCSYKN